MSFFMYFIPSCWVASYPARWVAPLPIRWVRSYFFAGYNSTHSLGTKQTTNKREDYSKPSTLYPLLR